MKLLSILAAATLPLSLVRAIPTASAFHKRAQQYVILNTTRDVFENLELFAEYSASSYKTSNIVTLPYGSPPRRLTCPNFVCPKLNGTANLTIVAADNPMPPLSPLLPGLSTLLPGLAPILSGLNLLNPFNIPAQYFVAVDPVRSLVVVSFEGTDLTTLNTIALGQGLTDFVSIFSGRTFDIPGCSGCKVISTFLNSWRTAMPAIVRAVNGALASQTNSTAFRVVFTGHSLGGALAAVAAAESRARFSFGATTPVDLYNYGAPFIGNNLLAVQLSTRTDNGQGTFRVTHVNDTVPTAPTYVASTVDFIIPTTGFYTDHFSPEYFITTPGAGTVARSEVRYLPTNITNNYVNPSIYGSNTTTFALQYIASAHRSYFIPITCVGC